MKKQRCNFKTFFSLIALMACFCVSGNEDHDRQRILNTLKSIEKKWQQQAQPVQSTLSKTSQTPAQVSAIANGQLLFFSSYVNRHYLGEILAVKHQTGAWIDLLSFFENVDFAIDVNPSERTAKGFYIKETNTFSLDLNTQIAMINGAAYTLKNNQFYIEKDALYIDSKLLAQWFSLQLTIDYPSLALYIDSRDAPLPVEKRLARASRVMNTYTGLTEPTLPWKASPYQALSSPLADLQINAVASDKNNDVGYSLLGANDLAYFNAQYYLAGRSTDLLTDSRLSLSREDKDAQLLGPLNATHVEFGDVLATQIGKRFNSSYARGFKINNKPLFKDINSNQVNLTGDIQPGWDVELYRNGVLLDQQLSLSDGRYLFENIDLLYGANNFELIFYGPQGQVDRKVEQYFIDGNTLNRGESFYEVSVTEQGQQLFNDSNFSYDQGWQMSGRYETGLTDALSVYAGMSILKNDEDDNRQNYAFGSNISVFDRVLLNIDYETNTNDEDELEFAARTELGEQSLRLSAVKRTRHSSLFDNESALITSNVYELSMAGEVFQKPYGRLNYQNRVLHQQSDTTGSGLQIDNTLSYAFNNMSLTNRLTYNHSNRFDYDNLIGNIRLQNRIGQVYSRFSIDYGINPDSEILAYQAKFNRNLTDHLQTEFLIRKQRVNDLTLAELGLSWQTDRFSFTSNVRFDDDDNWRLGLFSRFSIGYDKTNSVYFASQRSLATSGTLMVQVYLDNNNNGVMDDDEVGVAGVKVKGIQNFRQAITDEKGIAVLKAMPANKTTDIIIDSNSFSDPFLIPANNGFSVTPRAGFVEYVSIALNNSSEVEGTVYQVTDKGESKVAPFAKVALLDKNGRKIAQTQAAYDGYYLFTDLRPGQYQAVIDDNFKQRKSLKNTQQIQLNLSNKGAVIAGVDFVLTEKQQTPGYIANAGRFSSLAIMKVYYKLIKSNLTNLDTQDAFYLKKDEHYILALGYSKNKDSQLENTCIELKSKGLNCTVQAQQITH